MSMIDLFLLMAITLLPVSLVALAVLDRPRMGLHDARHARSPGPAWTADAARDATGPDCPGEAGPPEAGPTAAAGLAVGVCMSFCLWLVGYAAVSTGWHLVFGH